MFKFSSHFTLSLYLYFYVLVYVSHDSSPSVMSQRVVLPTRQRNDEPCRHGRGSTESLSEVRFGSASETGGVYQYR